MDLGRVLRHSLARSLDPLTLPGHPRPPRLHLPERVAPRPRPARGARFGA